MQKNSLGELLKSARSGWPEWLWNASIKLLGRPPEMVESLNEIEKQLETQKQKSQADLEDLESKLKSLQEERLQWQAKEASARKELHDAQQRTKDLLEQVVQLTHKERQAKQSLFDQHFKTGTTPLERNRFEMELAEARGRVKRAEEKAMLAEKKMAELEGYKRKASRVKDLESEAAWLKKQSLVYKTALDATIDKVRHLETRAERKNPTRKTAPVKKKLRAYRKPAIRKKRGRVDLKSFTQSA